MVAGRAPEGMFCLEDRVRDQLGGVLIGQTVKHPLALLPALDNPGQAQLRQMLRDGRRGLVRHIRKMIHRHLPRLPQREDDPHPGGVGQHREHLYSQLDELTVRIKTAHLLICIHTQILAHWHRRLVGKTRRDMNRWRLGCNRGFISRVNDATSATRGQWVLLSYRLPREPSTPRITLWRKLKKLGVAQFADNIVALPDDARSREHLEWLADEVLEWGGQAGIWIASATTQAQELHLIEQMRNARAAEYAVLTAQAAAALHAAEEERVSSLRRLRNQWRQITRRDYFPPPERAVAHTALRQLASPDPQTADHTQTDNTQTKESL